MCGVKERRDEVILIGCLRSFKVIPNGIVINLTKSNIVCQKIEIHPHEAYRNHAYKLL